MKYSKTVLGTLWGGAFRPLARFGVALERPRAAQIFISGLCKASKIALRGPTREEKGIQDLLGTTSQFLGKKKKKRKKKKGVNDRRDTEDNNATFLDDKSMEDLDPDQSDE